MLTPANLTNHFLIAMPSLMDPNFHQTVTYICAHNEDGAMGLVINRPMDLRLADILDQLDIEATADTVGDEPVFEGGPVQRERGFVIHQPAGEWDAVLRVSEEVAVATSRDILAAMARGEGPPRSLVALGYAGWGAGQLEQEMADNAWLSGPADLHILFDLPAEQRWEAAASLLGVDLHLLSTEAGHG
jgi:putative transcriptional regulator